MPVALLVISWLVGRRKHGSRNHGEAGFDSSVVYVTLKAQLLEAILMDENRSSTLGQYLQFGAGKKRVHEKYQRETGDTWMETLTFREFQTGPGAECAKILGRMWVERNRWTM